MWETFKVAYCCIVFTPDEGKFIYIYIIRSFRRTIVLAREEALSLAF